MSFKLTDKEIEVLNEQLGNIAPQLEARERSRNRAKEIEAQRLALGDELLDIERQIHNPIQDKDEIGIIKALLMDKVRESDNAYQE